VLVGFASKAFAFIPEPLSFFICQPLNLGCVHLHRNIRAMINITRRSLVPFLGILGHVFKVTTSSTLSGFFQLKLEIIVGLFFISSRVHPFCQGNWFRATPDTVFEQQLA
jgi:hypothetical protein